MVLSADQRDPGRFGDKDFSPLVPVTSITPRRVEVRIGQARAGVGLRYHRRVVRLGTLAIAVLLAACSGEIQSDIYEDLNPKDQVALEKWVEKALPVLSTKCVECHGGSMPMVAYLAGADDIAKRDTLIAYMPAVINLTAPMSSRMLTKGNHTGPALEAKEASDILSWIVAERDARGATTTVIRSEKFMAMLCTAGNPGDATCPITISCARETDVVARFGGDEFALILPDTGREGAVSVATRIRDRIGSARFLQTDGLTVHLTASIGVATLPDVAASAEELLQAADMAMYQVKAAGKDGIHVAAAPSAST